MALIKPLVEVSWLVTGPGPVSSGRIFLASCLPSSTPHLVEGIDVPDHALGEDFVLVEGDQRAEHCGGQFRVEEGVGRAVAGEGFGGHQLSSRCAADSPAAISSARASSGVLPFISASVWAR